VDEDFMNKLLETGFPEEITALTLSGKLKSLLAGLLKDLQQLTYLRAEKCGLEIIHPTVFSDLPRLEILSMKNNRLSSLPRDIFKNTRSLTRLDLSQNSLSFIENGTLRNMKALKRLDLHGNDLRVLSDDIFRGLDKLEFLSLSGNARLTFRGSPFAHLKSLQTLWLSRISGSGTFTSSLFDGATSLSNLNVANNNLTCISCLKLDTLKNLTTLTMDSNNFHLIANGTFKNMPNLKVMSMKGCSITHLAEDAFKGLHNMAMLFLSNNKLRVVSIATLSPLVAKQVYLSNNIFECSCEMLVVKNWLKLKKWNLDLKCRVKDTYFYKSILKMHDDDFFGCNLPKIQDCCDVIKTVDRGDDVTFECQADGVPPPTIIYQKLSGDALPSERTVLSLGNRTLKVKSVRGSDEGIFQCVAMNIRGAVAKRFELVLTGGNGDCPLSPKHCRCRKNRVSGGIDLVCNLPNRSLFHTLVAASKVMNNVSGLFVRGNVVSVENNDLKELKMLKTLNLEGANISKLARETFRGLTNIEQVFLSNNNLQGLPEGIFVPLRNIKTLSLRKNRINVLHRSTLADCITLESLHLGQNELEKIESGTFKNQKNLRILFLSDNRLSDVTPGSFEGLHNLDILSLSDNANLQLSDGVFRHLAKLRTLLLTNISNDGRFPSNVFRGLSSLKELHIGKNGLSCIKCFSWVPVSKTLESLNLEKNALVSLEKSAFRELRNLRFLMLRNSVIGEMETGTFSELDKLSDLDLSGNPIRMIKDGTFRGMTSLEKLDLSDCLIATLSRGALVGLNRLKSLFLSRNRLTTVSMETFQHIPNAFIDFTDNEWICDCSMFDLKNRFRRHNIQDDILCAGPGKVQGRYLQTLHDEEFVGCTSPKIASCCGQTVHAVEGDTLTLKCSAVGVPDPVVRYDVIDGYPLPSDRRTYSLDNRTIHVSDLSLENQGNITCTATNIAGKITKLYTILVQPRSFYDDVTNVISMFDIKLGVGVGISMTIVAVVIPVCFCLRRRTHKNRADYVIIMSELQNGVAIDAHKKLI
jgi:Leucine-rich repeat (LRR) protein